MSTSEAGAATVIPIRDDAAAAAAGKAPVAPAPAPAPAEASAAAAPAPAVTARKPRGLPLLLRSARGEGGRRCVALLDFLLRVAAFGPTLAAAISTGTDDETLTVFTQFFQFHANYADFPAFTFFMVVNAVAAGYLVLSLPFSAVGVVRPKAIGVRLLLLVCDMVMLALLTAAASSAAAIVYLAHTGNQRANWVAICMQFNGFCQRSSGAVVGSFLGVLVFMLLVVMAACSIRRR